MKNHPLKIYIDRLKGGDSERIVETLASVLMEVEEKDLRFIDKVIISGEAYLAKNHLVLHLKLKAKIEIPCAICNKMTEIDIAIDDFYHTEELTDLKGAVFDYFPEVRNALLLKVPQFQECSEGHCPERHTVNKYLNSGNKDSYQPFKDLSI